MKARAIVTRMRSAPPDDREEITKVSRRMRLRRAQGLAVIVLNKRQMANENPGQGAEGVCPTRPCDSPARNKKMTAPQIRCAGDQPDGGVHNQPAAALGS